MVHCSRGVLGQLIDDLIIEERSPSHIRALGEEMGQDLGEAITWLSIAAGRGALPERAVLWERMEMLLLGDTHWGKAAAFRAGGIPVPGGTTRGGLERLERVVARTGARKIVFLGDFLHARTGRAPATLEALDDWRSRHAALDLVLVRGNHDRGAGDPPTSLGIRSVEAPLNVGPFQLTHI